jgi:hypothetical protein
MREHVKLCRFKVGFKVGFAKSSRSTFVALNVLSQLLCSPLS